MVRFLSVILFSVVVLLGTAAQTSPFADASRGGSGYTLPENTEIRRQLSDWLRAPINEVLSTLPRVYRQMEDGGLVKVRVEETSQAVYQLFLNQQEYLYPVAGRGNVVIKRDKQDGSFIQMKIFLDDGADSFLRLFSFQDRTSLDVYLYGKRITADIPLPFTSSQIITAPLWLLRELTTPRIPWELFEPVTQRDQDRNLERLVERLRMELPRLGDNEDGAIDENGEYVFIENLVPQSKNRGLNCSGFAKWVVDGFVIPLIQRPLAIDSLKKKHLASRGNSLSRHFEQERDPFFGLDWTRNLASAITSLREERPVGVEECDVRDVPFFSYVEDVGYPVKELQPLLYLLARDNPGQFYLGSLNQPYGSDPPMRQHTHVALLFPYFDGLGRFQVVVLERNRETSIDSLKNRYGTDFVHLVRVSSQGEFSLP